jgi:hypothetical protein
MSADWVWGGAPLYNRVHGWEGEKMEGVLAQFVSKSDCNQREGSLVMYGHDRGGAKGIEDPAEGCVLL